MQAAMKNQSEPPSVLDSGKDMSDVICPAAANDQPLIVIYYPRGVGDVRQVHDAIKSLQQNWNLSTKTSPPDIRGTCACGNFSTTPPTSHVAAGNLGDEDALPINSTKHTESAPNVRFEPPGIQTEGIAIPYPSQKVNPHDYLEGNGTWANDSLYEDLLNDAEIDSMFNDLGPRNRAPISEAVGPGFAFSNELVATSSSINNNDMAINQVAMNMLDTVTAAQSAVSLPIGNVNNRFQCLHPSCGADFNRVGDLRRHQRAHRAPAYPCTVNGCVRRGPNAFHRRDKLLDHMRKKHGLAV